LDGRVERPGCFCFWGTNWLKSRRGSEAKPYFGCSGADAVEQNAGRIVAQVLLLRADGGLTPESLLPTLDQFVTPL
jgi:hypothetical protein